MSSGEWQETMTDLQVVAAYSAFLSGLGLRHLVGGSLASSAWGEQRYTNDADLVVHLAPKDLPSFVVKLPEDFIVEEQDIANALTDTRPFAAFQVLYVPTAFKIDNFVAKSDWDLQQLERAVPLNLPDGSTVPFASPEDMIVAKCRWFDLGRRVSDRQWRDLVRLYEVRREMLDAAYIEHWLAEFRLLDLWQEIRRQSTE